MPKTKRQKRSRTTPISRGVGLGVGAGDQAMYQAARLQVAAAGVLRIEKAVEPVVPASVFHPASAQLPQH